MKRTIRYTVTALLVALGATYSAGHAAAAGHARRDNKGKIVSVTADSVTIENARGQQFTYALSSATSTVSRQGAPVGALQVGAVVRINARANGAATTVRVLD
jgi:hypothetical protein